MDINADVGGAGANSYLLLADADRLMDGYPNAVAWLNFDEATRQRHLLDGTRKIDRYRDWLPQSSTQRLAFPTAKDPAGALPTEAVNALLEFLDWKASGELDSLKKLQAEGVTSRSQMGQSSSFKADESQLPAGARRELDTLWNRYSAPALFAKPVRRAGGRPEGSTRSLYEADTFWNGLA